MAVTFEIVLTRRAGPGASSVRLSGDPRLVRAAVLALLEGAVAPPTVEGEVSSPRPGPRNGRRRRGRRRKAVAVEEEAEPAVVRSTPGRRKLARLLAEADSDAEAAEELLARARGAP